MEDKTIVCVDCQQPFVFTAGEQQFYAERGLLELPKRCKPCRGQRRRRLSRRRKSGAERIEAPLESAVAQAGEDESAPVETHASSGNGVKPSPAGSSGPRTFWDERPEWVRQAMMKAVTPTAPADSGNGSRPGHPPVEAVEPEPEGDAGEAEVAFGNGEQRPDETRRRRRRRSRRRRRRVGDEAMATSATGSEAPSDPAVEG